MWYSSAFFTLFHDNTPFVSLIIGASSLIISSGSFEPSEVYSNTLLNDEYDVESFALTLIL